MVRTTNRQWTRLFFIVVIVMAFLGACYADSHWRIDPAALRQKSTAQNGDWIEIVSSIGEQAIQIFLGLTGSGK